MKVSKLVGDRYKNASSDCTIESQVFLHRGGYIKLVGTGIYSFFPLTKRISQKIEKILREEMDLIDGQEVMFPVVMPGSLWQESKRFDSIGSELLRFKDRNGTDMVLGMTHEEAAVQLVRDIAQTYTKYPFMIYQIQTKFRDEPRSRGGLIRTREFTMKDAYSFHTSQEDLEEYYERAYKAYQRIFTRCGIPEVIAVKSDSGMMGGRVSHEFMLLTEIGEDTIVRCPECGYSSNMEAADCIVDFPCTQEEPLQEVHTPNQKTIEEVCAFLSVEPQNSCKAVIYQRNLDDSLVIVFIRGDLEVNETKLRNILGEEIHPAVINASHGLVSGFIGPIGLPEGITVVFDKTLSPIKSLVAGANKEGYHIRGLNLARDYGQINYIDVAKAIQGGICPICGKHSISICKGIEVGNIFQLGTKYTESMQMRYSDSEGQMHYPIMGCYGIGVGRLISTICQVRHDKYGPIWPISIAPWQVEICAFRASDERVRSMADMLYKELQDNKIEVLLDDRDNVSAGAMFSDADLFGIPVRVIISPRSMDRGVFELSTRTKTISKDILPDSAVESIKELIGYLQDELDKPLSEI